MLSVIAETMNPSGFGDPKANDGEENSKFDNIYQIQSRRLLQNQRLKPVCCDAHESLHELSMADSMYVCARMSAAFHTDHSDALKLFKLAGVAYAYYGEKEGAVRCMVAASKLCLVDKNANDAQDILHRAFEVCGGSKSASYEMALIECQLVQFMCRQPERYDAVDGIPLLCDAIGVLVNLPRSKQGYQVSVLCHAISLLSSLLEGAVAPGIVNALTRRFIPEAIQLCRVAEDYANESSLHIAQGMFHLPGKVTEFLVLYLNGDFHLKIIFYTRKINTVV